MVMSRKLNQFSHILNEESSERPETNGERFKRENGYSKTMKRLMHRSGVNTLQAYRKLRKERKK